MKSIKIYVDGSCRNNKCGEGIGAWGFIVYDENNHKLAARHGVDENTTNNRMEMFALLMAQHYLLDCDDVTADIYMDSNLVYKGLTEWGAAWQRNGYRNSKKQEVANRDLWEQIFALKDKLPFIRYCKVRGHADDIYNNEVDAMVQEASMEYKERLNAKCNN